VQTEISQYLLCQLLSLVCTPSRRGRPRLHRPTRSSALGAPVRREPRCIGPSKQRLGGWGRERSCAGSFRPMASGALPCDGNSDGGACSAFCQPGARSHVPRMRRPYDASSRRLIRSALLPLAAEAHPCRRGERDGVERRVRRERPGPANRAAGGARRGGSGVLEELRTAGVRQRRCAGALRGAAHHAAERLRGCRAGGGAAAQG
jgi:hypothetical protein